MSSSTSSTSSTEENKDENNDQNNNNIAKNDNSMDFLEVVPSTAAPPPSYEDVVKKPQPTLPSYSLHNDSPPPFPQPAENYNQTIIYPSPSNSNSKRRREYRGCCCCNSSRNSRNKNCGCGWIIVLIVFIILTTISVSNNNACNNITLGPNPESFSFDPTNTIFKIDTGNARIRGGQVKIFYQQQTQQVVNVQVFTGANGVTPKFGTSNQNGVYELKVSQTSGFSIFNIPPRCMKIQVNVVLPYLTTADVPVPNTIQVEDLSLIMNDSVYPYQQKITLITEDGGIQLNGVTLQNDIVLKTKDGVVIFNNTTASNVSVTTNDGDIHGLITSISNGFSALTNSGDLKLLLGIASGVNNAKIKIQTNDGNVDLGFANSSFSGSYNILSRDGRIITDDDSGVVSENRITGNYNNGGNDLNISTRDGNVEVFFK